MKSLKVRPAPECPRSNASIVAHAETGAQRRAPPTRDARARATTATAGRAFQELVDIMARLRGPDGCPWDREQTIESLRGFVLEETYEVLDAIDRGDHAALRGEIGDLLFEGVFLAQIESDEGRFTVADSLHSIAEKLIRRHPHIFGAAGSPVTTPGQVLEQWEQIKAREQQDAGERRSILRGMPKTMPSLLRAHEIGSPRRRRRDSNGRRATDVVDKIEEEVAEVRRAVETKDAPGPKRKSATCCSRSPTLPDGSGSSRNRRCGRRTRSSAPASKRWRGPSKSGAGRSTIPPSKKWTPNGNASRRAREPDAAAAPGRDLDQSLHPCPSQSRHLHPS